jgi:hypothetical protein
MNARPYLELFLFVPKNTNFCEKVGVIGSVIFEFIIFALKLDEYNKGLCE